MSIFSSASHKVQERFTSAWHTAAEWPTKRSPVIVPQLCVLNLMSYKNKSTIRDIVSFSLSKRLGTLVPKRQLVTLSPCSISSGSLLVLLGMTHCLSLKYPSNHLLALHTFRGGQPWCVEAFQESQSKANLPKHIPPFCPCGGHGGPDTLIFKGLIHQDSPCITLYYILTHYITL